MTQKPVELILARHLASHLGMPMLLFDAAGNVVFYNQSAEALLGRRFDETGGIPLDEWYSMFKLIGEDGDPIPLEARPVVVALRQHRPAHLLIRLERRDGITKKIEATAFPIEGQGSRHLGAVVIFWEKAAPA